MKKVSETEMYYQEKNFIRQQIYVKIQSFHINNLKSVKKNYPKNKTNLFVHKEQRDLNMSQVDRHKHEFVLFY